MAAFASHPGAHGSFTTTEKRANLLDRAMGSSNSEWVYVQASGAIAQYACVAIDEDGTARQITDTLAATSQLVGFAQIAFADNEYGWVATKGSDISVLVKASCAADAILFTTASAGVLDDASASAGSMQIHGVVAVAAATASGTQAEEIIATCVTVAEGT